MLDEFDKKILKIIQKNCRVPTELIAEKVGLSASAIQRRIKKLKADNIIKSEVAILSNSTLPQLITFIAGIEIDRDNYVALRQLNQWAEERIEVQQSFYVTGDNDLVMIINATSTKHYDQLIELMMSNHPNIKRVNTQVVLDAPKQSLELPL
ncbi:Lrp/AsnC family transcriptional regulator [Vibrio sp.]|uniref:Lrp/AsnC family transcriptional regulator n=1 Tax=Vibrio viridaestus TaxID=2487322 RepID=UPI001FB68A03|nr:Lrp/AsnC family transcriptional regulator [Vibrio viridaestus]MDC0609652.1 Lrp/AsnC family transcriptional regulator [Vibrio sp.]